MTIRRNSTTSDSRSQDAADRPPAAAADRFVFAVLGALAFHLLTCSVEMRPSHDVNGVLCAVALMIFALSVLSLMFGIAMVRRRPLQLSLASLFVLIACAAVTCGWLQTKIGRARRQREITERLEPRLDGRVYQDPWNVAKHCRPVEGLLNTLLGRDFFTYPVELSFSGGVDEEACELLSQMPTLEVLVFKQGELSDSWLLHLKNLPSLRSLVLPVPGPSDEAVIRLQRALPACEISRFDRNEITITHEDPGSEQ